MAEVIIFHNGKKLHFKDLDADQVAYLTKAYDLQATATPRRGAEYTPLYTEREVKGLIHEYVSDKAGFIPLKLDELIDEWWKHYKTK